MLCAISMISDHHNYLNDDESSVEHKMRLNAMHNGFLHAESDGGPFLYTIDSPASCPNYGGTSSGMTLREQDDQLQLLRKENFHLKLRIYFLQQTQNQSACKGDGKEGLFENIHNQIDSEKLELKV